MLELFEVGEILISHITSIGDFLIEFPIDLGIRIREGLITIFDALGLDGLSTLASYINAGAVSGQTTITSYIFGTGLVAIVCVKFIKFCLDIIL